MKAYERLIPLGVAVSVFMSLVTLTRVLAWVPAEVLRPVFLLLTALGAIK
ncbi:MAG: hypothetical protein MUQ10_05830 [Anaerolineae bacterium]|nr:hypothetical protein [Anaerolineae bacterium]